jgi:hypothetical protein
MSNLPPEPGQPDTRTVEERLHALEALENRDPSTRSRADDRRRVRRDLWLVVITGLVAWALVNTDRALDRIDEGRRISLGASCAATAAVIDAGRATITSSGALPPELAAFLESYGYPDAKTRKAQAIRSARDYANAIANRVEAASGVPGLVDPEGRLKCKVLEKAAIDGEHPAPRLTNTTPRSTSKNPSSTP